MSTLFISTKVRIVLFKSRSGIKPKKAGAIYPNEVFLLMSTYQQENNGGVFLELFHPRHGQCITFSDSRVSLPWAKPV